MKRIFEDVLNFWKNAGMNKSLMIIGATQIGKDYFL